MPAYIETFAWNLEDLQVPWHGQGNAVESYDNYKDFMQQAGLDWKVKPVIPHFDRSQVQTTTQDGLMLLPNTTDFTPIDSHRVMVRDTDGAVLGLHSKSYMPLQNHEAFQFTEDLVRDGEMRYVSAGAINGGRRVFVVAKIESDPLQIVHGDLAEKYVLLANSHDGSMSVNVKPTGVLVVCQNTLNMALADGRKGLKVKHTRNMHKRLVEGKRLLGIIDDKYDRFQKFAQSMARIPISKPEFNQFAIKLVAPGKVEDDFTPAQERALDNLRYLFVSGPGQQIEGRKGTVWGAHNAVTAWTTHIRESRSAQRDGHRVDYTLLGRGDAINAEAEKILTNQYQLAA